jgi:hypothetical protein
VLCVLEDAVTDGVAVNSGAMALRSVEEQREKERRGPDRAIGQTE